METEEFSLFSPSKDIQRGDIKVASLCFRTDPVLPLFMKSLHSASLPSLACPVICLSTLLKPISVAVPSALPQSAQRGFSRAVLALFLLMLHTSTPAEMCCVISCHWSVPAEVTIVMKTRAHQCS